MIRRVTNRQRELEEEGALLLVQAFVISRIVYSTPYLQLPKKDVDQLGAIIRKATKLALGIPVHSSSENLLGMAKHNTIRELTEAHLSDQRIRLSQTPAGRAILAKIGWQIAYHQDKEPIPTIWATIIESKPIPKT